MSARVAGFRGLGDYDPQERYMSSRVYNRSPIGYPSSRTPNTSMLREEDSFVQVKQEIGGGKVPAILPPILNSSPKNRVGFHHQDHHAVLPTREINLEHTKKIAEETKRNMEAPGVEQFRHITSNKGYGVSNDNEVKHSLQFLGKKSLNGGDKTRNNFKNSVSLQDIRTAQRYSSRDLTP